MILRTYNRQLTAIQRLLDDAKKRHIKPRCIELQERQGRELIDEWIQYRWQGHPSDFNPYSKFNIPNYAMKCSDGQIRATGDQRDIVEHVNNYSEDVWQNWKTDRCSLVYDGVPLKIVPNDVIVPERKYKRTLKRIR